MKKTMTLMEEISDDTNRWRDTPCSWTRRINIVSDYPKQSTDSMLLLLSHFSRVRLCATP